MSGEKKKLTLAVCSEEKKDKSSEGSFEVMLNPTDYSLDKTIKYNEQTQDGENGSDLKFMSVDPSSLDLKLILDGTGTIRRDGSSNLYPSVKNQIKKLMKTVYSYNGGIHQPNYIKIVWGDLLFYGRLTNIKVDYKMFKPSGEAIRAEVKLNFKEFFTKSEQVAIKNNSSPDMTHIVTVKAGDTLPLLCQKIYEDASYYIEVAKANDLINFRSLKPGTKLLFPSIK